MVTMIRGNRIRSTYQRRVLDWLADGGGTVTEVSKALKIRVPHASAALKQLRESGDVVRDDVSIRGSRYRLSSQGLARLESDGFARLNQLVSWPPPPGAAGIILAREGPMLLLGYATKPAGPLLGMPERPMDEESGVVENSSGNAGESNSWRWAVQRGEGPVWWDLETKRKSSPPNEQSPMTLTAWMERPKVIGIVRARLLDEAKPWPLSVGSWFTSLPSGYWPELPRVLRDGDAPIGRAGNSGPIVSPQGGIHAILGRRIDRSAIANIVSDNSFLIIDGDLIGNTASELPIEILRSWLKLVHPRLSESSLNEKFERLAFDIESGISNSLTRKVLTDFPGRKWSDKIQNIIDSRYMSERAGEASLLYALEEIDKPIIVDWRWKHVDTLDRLVNDSRCRIIMTELLSLDLPFKLTSTGDNKKFNLEMAGRLQLPISISLDSKMPRNWMPPSTPSEIVRGNFTSIRSAENENEALWLACQLKDGDDIWADRHESKFPLASWIATSKDNQVARWRRIGNMLDPVWAGLADLNKFDDEDLAELALHDDDVLEILIQRIREEPLRFVSREINHPAIATGILLSREWIEEFPNVVDVWLSQPMRLREVLRKNWSNPEVSKLAIACNQHKLLLDNQDLDREQILAIMEDVHYSVWKNESTSWLPICLSSTMGRSALSQLQLPWPVILYDQKISSDELSLVHHIPDGIGKDSLLDALEGITSSEKGVSPPRGRTHPYSGWLFQEKVPLIPLQSKWDHDIHIELHRRFQQ
jgi:hypothetical protein